MNINANDVDNLFNTSWKKYLLGSLVLKSVLVLLRRLKFQVLEVTGVNKSKCCFAIVV